MIFSGADGTGLIDNVVEHNVITNSSKNLLRVPYFSDVGELSIPASVPCARLLAGGEVNPG